MSVRLLVLGVLNDRDAHGYQIKEIARASSLEKWAEVGYGSIYHALTSLEDEGLVQEVGVEQEGERPPRLVYRITEQGRAAFLELLKEASLVGYGGKSPIHLALAFIAELPPEERVQLFEERLRQMQSDLTKIRLTRERLQPLESEAPWVLATLDHHLGHLDLEIAWTRTLIEEIHRWRPRPKNTHL
jgi:DNA-binding PadR family transcriptional regulator